MENNKSNTRIFNFRVIAIFVLISTYLVLRWLPDGQISGGGDVGIPALYPQKQLEEVSSSWWESHATGVVSPITFTAVPFYIVLSVIEKIGIGSGMTQKGLFFLILSGGAISIYFLALNFKFNKFTSILAGLFYIFNLTSLSIWQRGVHNSMLMLLLAPVSLLVLVKGINTKRYISIIWLNIISFLLSYAFGALGYVFAIWLLWTVYLLIILRDEWEDKSVRKFILTYCFILVISWIGTNLWWIIHLLQSSHYALGQLSQADLKAKSSDVLVALKPYHEPSIILRGLSRFYLFVVKDWGEIYSLPFYKMLSWFPTLIVFSTVFFKANYKSTIWKFLIVLMVIILILSKGLNPPLGELNKISFNLFQFLAPLRNTYEKMSVVLIIPFSLLFALGITQLISILQLKKLIFLKLIVLLIMFCSLTILVWPLWLGRLFVSEGRKYTISIPSYYKEANDWLKGKIGSDDTRILHLPLSWGESVDYDWGYTGIEPSQYFFNGSSIGYQIGIPDVDLRVRDLLILIHNQDTVSIQKAIASLNIGWIVIHNETLYRDRILEPPERINKWLATRPYFLEYQKDIGKLSIFKVKDQYRLGHFYPGGKLVGVDRSPDPSSIKIWDEIKGLNDGFLIEVPKDHGDRLNTVIEKNIVFPKGKMKYYPSGFYDSDVALRELGRVDYSPDSLTYNLIDLKDNILGFLNQNDDVRECFGLSSKKLKESVLLARESKLYKSKTTLVKYKKQLDRCTTISKETLNIYLNTPIFREEILGQLLRQRIVLMNEFKNEESLKEKAEAENSLNEYLANLGIIPKYKVVKLDKDKQVIVFNYSITKDGKYDLKINKPSKELIESPPKIIQIDDRSIELSPIDVNEEIIRYPTFEFSKGFHEIQLQSNLSKNLIEKPIMNKQINPDVGFIQASDFAAEEHAFLGEATNSPINLNFDLSNLNIGESYEVSFDLNFYQGSRPIITIIHDTDSLDSSGNFKPAVRKELEITTYPVELQGLRFDYKPSLNATSAKLTFTLDRNTKALIKNIKVRSILNYDLVLEKGNMGFSQKLATVNLKWNKISPTLYNLDLINQEQPYILVFAETFHPLWQITDRNEKKIELPHFSINGFANGWLVEKPLPEKFKVEFVLQRNFTRNIIISIIVFIMTLTLLLFLDFRKRLK